MTITPESKAKNTQFLFLRTLEPVVVGAGLLACTFLLAAPPIPLIVPITVLLAGSFFAATGFLTIVPLLASLESLIVLALPLATLGADAGAGATVLLPRPTPVVFAGSAGFRVAARVDLAFSTMLVSIPAAPPAGVGATGLKGDIGRARLDFAGDARTGERGKVRELADRGDRTWDCSFALDVVRAGGAGGPRGRFFGFSISSFSLSTEYISLLKMLVDIENRNAFEVSPMTLLRLLW